MKMVKEDQQVREVFLVQMESQDQVDPQDSRAAQVHKEREDNVAKKVQYKWILLIQFCSFLTIGSEFYSYQTKTNK